MQGERINEILHCLDVGLVMISHSSNDKVEKQKEYFSYHVIGKLINKLDGLVRVGGLVLEIDSTKIPKDIKNDDYIEFDVSRIDLW